MGTAFQGELIVCPGWWLEENRGERPASCVAESLKLLACDLKFLPYS